MRPKTALITGITGQDGSYLSEFLLNKGYKVIMPKNDDKIAKRIGFIVLTTVNYELRKTDQDQNIRHYTYHENKENYAIVLVSLSVLENLGFG